MNNLPKIIAVVGTTASGKSDLAIEIAKEFDGEVISVDSRQIYKDMDIGTNKEPGNMVKRDEPILNVPPFQDSPVSLSDVLNDYYEVEGIPHYMISVVYPDQLLTLAHFQFLAFQIIDDILERGKLPILVGGTSLYTSAIAENWQIPDAKPNPNLRKELESLSDIELIKRLDAVDQGKTETIDLGNRRRLIRAIEIAEQGKMVKSPKKLDPKYETLYLAPRVDREEVYRRINDRVDKMLDQGLIEEVKTVGEKYGYGTVAMTGHAYQQIGKYLQSEWDLEKAVEESKKVTRRYAKRQMTWWRKYGDVHWVENKNEAFRLVQGFLRISEV
jgi:tRNA dimethylallyltransferase